MPVGDHKVDLPLHANFKDICQISVFSLLLQSIQVCCQFLADRLLTIFSNKRYRFLQCQFVKKRRYRLHRRKHARRQFDKNATVWQAISACLADGRSPFLEHVHPFCSKQDKEQIRRFLSRQVKGITRNMSFCFPPQWAISRRARNRLMHARNGNTYSQFAASSSKGRGKTKTKGQQTRADAILSPEIQEEMFRNAIKDAMPLCQKQQSADWSHARVVPAEWKSPVLHHSEMTSAEFAVHQNNAFLICFGKLGTPKLRLPCCARSTRKNWDYVAILCRSRHAPFK